MRGVDDERLKKRWQAALALGVLLLVVMNAVLFVKFGLRRERHTAPAPIAPATNAPTPPQR